MQGGPTSGHKIQTSLNKTCKIIVIFYIRLYCYVLEKIYLLQLVNKWLGVLHGSINDSCHIIQLHFLCVLSRSHTLVKQMIHGWNKIEQKIYFKNFNWLFSSIINMEILNCHVMMVVKYIWLLNDSPKSSKKFYNVV